MENAKQLRPIGQLLMDAWKAYRLNCKKISLLMLWGLIGIVPYVLTIAIDIGFSRQLAGVQSIVAILIMIFYIIFLYWIISTVIGLIILIKNPEKKIIDVFNEGRKLVWGDLAIGMLVFLFVGLWSILLVVPGIIYSIFYSFTLFVFVYDGYRRSAALTRSKELVSGYWWPVFGRKILGIAILIIFMVLYMLVLRGFHATWLIGIIQIIYYVITVFFLVPAYIIFLSLIYTDLVAIKPTSALPKEKKDHWLVVVASVFFALVFIIILSILFYILSLAMM
jgi:hypothetical protein